MNDCLNVKQIHLYTFSHLKSNGNSSGGSGNGGDGGNVAAGLRIVVLV